MLCVFERRNAALNVSQPPIVINVNHPSVPIKVIYVERERDHGSDYLVFELKCKEKKTVYVFQFHVTITHYLWV